MRSISAPTNFLKKLGTATATGTVLWALQGGMASAASFQGLGDLPGGNFGSIAFGVSADGSTVVGYSNSANGSVEAFRWTQSGGIVGLGDLPGGNFDSIAFGVSADGSTIVGNGNSANGIEAFRWTQSGGIVGLGDLPGGVFTSRAKGVSGDGSIIVGQGTSAASKAVRWTQSGGIIDLGVGFGSTANAISGDGSTVVGFTFTSGLEAFRWTQSEGIVGLGDLPGGIFDSRANGVSADGSTIVGRGTSANGIEAFRWTQSGGIVGLGGDFIEAYGVSADGSVVVGAARGYDEAVIWDSTNGIRSVKDILVNDFGLDLTGWNLLSATGISADGLTIVGYGSISNGSSEAWIARLDSTPNPPPKGAPEPSNIFGLGLLGLGLAATKMKGVLSKKAKLSTIK